MKMNNLSYKYCIVPQCENTATTTPHKLFLCVPKDKYKRQKWLQLAKKPNRLSNTSKMYFCEDHFDLPNDMANYIEYRVMGSVSKVLIKPDCYPSKFECQSIRKNWNCRVTACPYISRKNKTNEAANFSNECDMNKPILNSRKTSDNIKPANPQMGTMETELQECRACLEKFDLNTGLYNLFNPWPSAWNGMENSIAEDLRKITNIQILNAEHNPKNICKHCCLKLMNACTFVDMVKRNDIILKERSSKLENDWPEPIQINSVNGLLCFNNLADKIKKEVISDDESFFPTDTYNGEVIPVIGEVNGTEIKIEPEEITEQHIPFMANGCILPQSNLGSIYGECEQLVKDSSVITRQNHFKDKHSNLTQVKDERISENEETLPPDVPLDCMLCTKKFTFIEELKAHVISQHSYKAVRRKLGDSHTPEETDGKETSPKYSCVVCPKSLATLTEQMEHELSHNKHVCYGCKRTYNTFSALTNHRRRCIKVRNKRLAKMRLRAKARKAAILQYEDYELECTRCNMKFANYFLLHKHMVNLHS